MHRESRTPPVFLDPTGRRWRRVRGWVLAVGVVTTLLALVLVGAVLVPPVLPALTGQARDRELAEAPRWATTRGRRAHLAARRRLLAALDRTHPPPALRPAHLSARAPRAGRHASLRAIPPTRREASPVGAPVGEPIVAGFYVNWDDNALASLRAHATELDWIVCEWAFLAPGGDSVALDIDRRVPAVLGQLPATERPRPTTDRKSTRLNSSHG